MKVYVTTHAVERFQERHAPALSMRDARSQLELIAEMAAPLKTRTSSGQAIWKAGEIALVMKRDSGEFICVTVLPPEESRATIADDLERELAEESKRDIEEMRRRIESEQSPPWNLVVLDASSLGQLINMTNRDAKHRQMLERLREQERIAEERSAAKHRRSLETVRAQRELAEANQAASEKRRRHDLDREDKLNKARRAIRIAVPALLEQHTEEAGAAIAAIAAIEPSYLTPDFLDAAKKARP